MNPLSNSVQEGGKPNRPSLQHTPRKPARQDGVHSGVAAVAKCHQVRRLVCAAH